MKILTQNREMVIETPRNMWSTNMAEKGVIVCSNDYNPIIGCYDSPERAREVLNEMFDYMRNGKKTYIMPEQ